MALTYILSSPHLFTPHLIVVSTFNTPLRALLVAYTLHLLNLTDIPILIGRQTSNRSATQSSWVPPHFTLPSYRASGGRVIDDGVTALVDFVTAWPSPSSPSFVPLRYVQIAPASSLGALLTRYPSAAPKLTVFAMNGCIRVGYGNASRIDAEYNTATDVGASQVMYAQATRYASPGLVLAPLDSTIFEQFNGGLWKELVVGRNDSAHPAVALLLDAYQHWWDAGGKNNGALQPYSPETGSSTMFDVQAAYSAGAVKWEGSGGGGGGECVVGEVEGLVSECLTGVVVNATGYVEVGVKGGVNVSAQVGVVGGRASPYKAIEAIGRIVLTAIASVRSPPTPHQRRDPRGSGCT